jgi:ATP/ADP translocase
MSEQSPFQPTFPTPPQQPQSPQQPSPQQQPQVTYAPPPSAPPQRRSPVLGSVALGIAAFGLLAGLLEQVLQRQFLLQTHYSSASFALFSGVSVTFGVVLDVVVIAIAAVALVGRRGTIPAAIALGVCGSGLISVLGSLLVNALMSFSG